MGLYLKEKVDDSGVLAIWELTEGEIELKALLPETRAKNGMDAKSEKRRKERLAVELLLQDLFGTAVCLAHHPNGQPFLLDRADGLSIAHSRRFVAVLSHPQKRVGVDMECLERDFSVVAQRALSKQEESFLSVLSIEQRSLQLAILWSAKEALYKCISQEGVDFATQMEVAPFIPEESGVVCAHLFDKDQKGDRGDRISVHLLKYKIIDNHILVYLLYER